MLRLRDVRSGEIASVTPARRGELSTYTDGRAPGGPRLGDLRGFLLADLIGRVAARRRLRVSAWTGAPDDDGLRTACDALNIYPAQFSASPPDPLDVGVWAAHPDQETSGGSHWVRAGLVRGDGPAADALAAAGDPLALRLAFLRTHYSEPFTLSSGELGDAGGELQRLREQVAEWATHPSRPMAEACLTRVTGALDNDLDIPSALSALRALAADRDVPPGAKFETFASLDQVLGLDLARDIGR